MVTKAKAKKANMIKAAVKHTIVKKTGKANKAKLNAIYAHKYPNKVKSMAHTSKK